MVITTTAEVPGYRAVRTFGLVRGNTIRGRHAGVDIIAWLRGLVGGEVHEYTKLMAEAREQAIDRMVDEARTLGANAVICVRFETMELMRGASEILCYGTAVVLEQDVNRASEGG
jgi:uncharacterized protein YbjQ (UPF0145 family)